MSHVSTRTIRTVQEMSYQLSACDDARELERAAMAGLLETIGADFCATNDFVPGPDPLRVVMSRATISSR